jgi:hypothetical protein
MNEEAFKPIWTKSEWKWDDLHDKTVEFRIPKAGGILRGDGRFVIVGPNPDGLLFVQIEQTFQGRNWAELVQWRHYLPQPAVDRIRRHPDQSVAEFLLE